MNKDFLKKQSIFIFIIILWLVLVLFLSLLWSKEIIQFDTLESVTFLVPGVEYWVSQSQYENEAKQVWTLLFFSSPFVLLLGFFIRVEFIDKNNSISLKTITIFFLIWLLIFFSTLFGFGDPVETKQIANIGLLNIYHKSYWGMLVLSFLNWTTLVCFTLILVEFFKKINH